MAGPPNAAGASPARAIVVVRSKRSGSSDGGQSLHDSPVSSDVFEDLRSYQIVDVLRAPTPAWGFYYSPRLGKSRTACRTLLRWIREEKALTHLIVGPLTALEITWQRELRAHGFETPANGGGPNGFLVPLLEAPSGESKVAWAAKIIREIASGAAGGRPVVVLLNDDILSDEWAPGKTITDNLVKWAPQGFIRDEAHRDSNAGSARSRCLRRLSRYTHFRRALTGTPDPNGYVNLYSQMAVLDPRVFGTNKTRFLKEYAIATDPYYRTIIGYRNEDELLAKVRGVASIVRAEDYFDVPPLVEVSRYPEMPGAAREMYRTLKNRSVLEVPEYAIDIDGTHRLAKLARLAQLTAGYLPTEDPENDTNIVWLHEVKIDSVLADCAEQLASGQKIIVSHRWRPEGERVAERLRKRFGRLVVAELNGRTKGDRAAIIRPFDLNQDGEGDAKILVVQEATGGVSVSFARADHLHFLTWSLDYGAVEQMSLRTWHEEKKYRTETYHIVPQSVDVAARATIVRKKSASIMMREVGFAAMAEGRV
jgi:hypothetical protein